MKSDELNTIYDKIKSLKNAGNLPLTSPNSVESTVRLIPDEKIAPSLFKPSQIEPNVYYATSLTIRAVKKDIFMAGDGFEDLEMIRPCLDCGKNLDLQFWKFCPFCEGKIAV